MKKYWIRNAVLSKEDIVMAESERAAVKKKRWKLEDCTIRQWRVKTGWSKTTEKLLHRKLVIFNQQHTLLEEFVDKFEDK